LVDLLGFAPGDEFSAYDLALADARKEVLKKTSESKAAGHKAYADKHGTKSPGLIDDISNDYAIYKSHHNYDGPVILFGREHSALIYKFCIPEGDPKNPDDYLYSYDVQSGIFPSGEKFNEGTLAAC